MKVRVVALALSGLVVVLLGAVALQMLRAPVLDGFQASVRPLVQTVVATGRVVAVSRAQVGSPVTGVVMERRVREGDVVQAGDVLAVLRADELEAAVREAEAALAELEQSTLPQARAALREAEERLAQAVRETTRRRDLFARGLIAREPMEQAAEAEAVLRTIAERARLDASALATGNPGQVAALARLANARALLERTTIRAELAGTVLTRNAEPGDLVQPGRVLFEIAHAGATEVLVPLDERNLGVLALGQPARCVADAYPSQPFPATVTFIAPGVDPQRGTVDVRLAVDPVPDFLRQDMTVSVNVETGRRDSALVVPNDALDVIDGDQAHLLRVVDGRVERHQVTIGLRGIAATEVVAGLRAGDWVLADATQAPEPGSRVRVRPAGGSTDPAGHQSRRELPVSLD